MWTHRTLIRTATFSILLFVSSGVTLGQAIIDNGIIQLGINEQGHLNLGGGTPSCQTGTTVVGLRFLPNGGCEATAPGCLCEGWGVADTISGTSGWASEDYGVAGLTTESFSSTASTACSVVRMGTTFRVTHNYQPHSDTPFLYRVNVRIENIGLDPANAQYVRRMDFDAEPTAFSEWITIQGSSHPTITLANDNGFASPDPLATPPVPIISPNGDFVDSGPADHGAYFHFDFGVLAPGERLSFETYYGAAVDEVGALAALTTVGADAYSLAQCDDPFDPIILGDPNTFIFGFGKLTQDIPAPCLPPPGPFDFKYSFADYPFENDGPHDVAVFGTCAKKQWVFVTDPAFSNILRFRGDADNNLPAFIFPPSFLGDGPFGIAVNDIARHPNHSQVYVTDQTAGFPGLIKVYNTAGCYLADVNLGGGLALVSPDGIAVDEKGNVYVVDSGASKVHRIDSAFFETIPACSLPLGMIATPSLTIDTSPQQTSPVDVSVDVAGRIHVTYLNSVAGLLVYEPNGTFVDDIPVQGPSQYAHGVDAKDPFGNPWFTDTNLFSHIFWDLLNATWTAGPTLVDIPWTFQRLGMETQRYVVNRFPIPAFGRPRKLRCEERLFTAGLPELGVYGRDFNSVARPPGAVAWYPLDDKIGAGVLNLLGVNGFRVASPDPPVPSRGVVRCSLCFDGQGGGVVAPSYAKLEFGTQSVSVEGWIRADRDPTRVYFFDKRNVSAVGMALFLDDGWLGVELDDGTGYFQFAPQVDENFISDGGWHHFTVVIDRQADNVLLFVDGLNAATMIAPLSLGGSLSSGSNLYLGYEAPFHGTDGFRGNLDEVTVYRAALGCGQIERIACAYCAGKHYPTTQPGDLVRD